MAALQVIELFAGNDPQGRAIVERLSVRQNEDNSVQLVKSPAFIRGLASGGDKIQLVPDTKEFIIKQHSGNLCIRVYAKQGLEAINEQLTPEFEKLGGELDTETPRFLVYSIHVSCGFKTIELLLNRHVGNNHQAMWAYGNVYDPVDGVTPLNWWNKILQPE
ncbi:phosphotyrosine protein phosphatase [Candidatus Endobugula sertula]|uniref:Phosphotyrosine protein phosphatase n=1 Tax=Candidatus Endobugula sertula TaxID=62101 RepID=A0A1D2QR25_9GAMM|nr:phosphotyrosine protein phosphatase [Candidatus Endobugula sertula]